MSTEGWKRKVWIGVATTVISSVVLALCWAAVALGQDALLSHDVSKQNQATLIQHSERLDQYGNRLDQLTGAVSDHINAEAVQTEKLDTKLGTIEELLNTVNKNIQDLKE